MKGPTAILLVALLSLAACSDPVSLETDDRQLVRVAPAQQGALAHRLSFSSTLLSVNRARLAFQSGGIVASRPASLGSVVRAGELLATLDNPELGPAQRAAAAALQEAITRRDQARRDLERLRRLEVQEVVGEEAVEQKQAELDSLEAGLERAGADLAATRSRLADASLVAPFDGVISAINVEPGEFVAPGEVVMAIGGLDRLELEVLLPARMVSQVIPGAESEVQVPQFPGMSWTGRVTELSAIGEQPTGLFPVVVEIAVDPVSTPLRAGMLGRAWFEYSENEGFIVPLSAIVDPVGGDPRIYRVDDGQVTLVPVDIIAASDARVAVSPRGAAAISDGDLVVTEGHRALTDGQRVRTVL
jgi:RND family efflux transporter MFP subunit